MEARPRRLPRRDLWLLPLIAAVTVLVVLAAAETGARMAFASQEVDACQIADPATGISYAPNCTSRMKAAEGPWYDNHYNECGYRTPDSCGPVPAGARRLAFVGSSVTAGYLTPYEQSAAGRLAADLTRACGAPVQIQNLGGLGYYGRPLLARMDAAMRLHPLAVVTMVTPYDILVLDSPTADPAYTEANVAPAPAAPPARGGGLQQRLFDLAKDSRMALMLQHFVFRIPRLYIPLYLRYGDKADFLRPPFTPRWQARLRVQEATLAAMADRAHAAGIPLILVFFPQEAQLVMMAGGDHPPGIDPDALSRALAAMSERHGVDYMDAGSVLARQPDPQLLYYQVNAHPAGAAQTLVADALARRITGGLVPDFAACHGPAVGADAAGDPGAAPMQAASR